jgi:hypothetical protein
VLGVTAPAQIIMKSAGAGAECAATQVLTSADYCKSCCVSLSLSRSRCASHPSVGGYVQSEGAQSAVINLEEASVRVAALETHSAQPHKSPSPAAPPVNSIRNG